MAARICFIQQDFDNITKMKLSKVRIHTTVVHEQSESLLSPLTWMCKQHYSLLFSQPWEKLILLPSETSMNVAFVPCKNSQKTKSTSYLHAYEKQMTQLIAKVLQLSPVNVNYLYLKTEIGDDFGLDMAYPEWNLLKVHCEKNRTMVINETEDHVFDIKSK